MDPIYYFYVRDTGTDSPFVIGSQLIASFLSLSLSSRSFSLYKDRNTSFEDIVDLSRRNPHHHHRFAEF